MSKKKNRRAKRDEKDRIKLKEEMKSEKPPFIISFFWFLFISKFGAIPCVLFSAWILPNSWLEHDIGVLFMVVGGIALWAFMGINSEKWYKTKYNIYFELKKEYKRRY
ncbi:hypothetical protein [Metabacillus halosaccharovorans]|uniref:hypothetical protein n=1 Tax=Metabacillus halosaccharovorans TaxID=930124 RepID=UPI0037359F20